MTGASRRPEATGPGAADVVVAGAGPAGLATAAALAERGLSVVCLAPSLDVPWRSTYAAWESELPPGTPVARRHEGVDVVWAAGQGTRVPRPYVVLDLARLQTSLTARADAAGVRMLRGTAAGVEHPGPLASVVRTGDGRVLPCRLVVDGTGAASALVTRPGGGTATAFQTASGLIGTVDGAPGSLLMDWSADHLPPDERAGPPTFLYALDLGDGRTLVEETALAARPAVGLPVLERRLRLRLAALGARVHDGAAVEHVRIPLDLAVPPPQRVVAVGVAGGAVHPATGYSVGAALQAAPRMADAVAAALDVGGDPSAAAWAVLWPRAARATRVLHGFGLEALLGMSPTVTASFFAAFFSLPPEDAAGYLSGRQGPGATAATMSRLFARAPDDVRRALAGAGLGPAGRSALTGLLRAARP